MTRKRMVAIAICLLLSAAVLRAQTALEFYQRGRVQEEAHGDLRQAIQFYERAAKDAGNDRVLAARALVRAAECYRQLGDVKANEVFAEVVRSYPEQRESIVQAQTALALAGPHGAQQPLGLPASVAAELESTVTPVIKASCVNCHSEARPYGVKLDHVTEHFVTGTQDFAQDAAIWEKVLTRLRTRAMPPRNPLADAANNRVIAALESALDLGYPPAVQPSDLADDTTLAERMARFIWSDKPDAVLVDLAARGLLKDPTVIEHQVNRMLADPKSEKLVSSFFSTWLHVDRLSYFFQPPLPSVQISDEARVSIGTDIARARTQFPERTEELMQAMLHETELFVSDQIHRDRPALELWTANYSFMNERLAGLYGIPNITGTQFRRVNFDNDRRAGLLGQLGVLTATSYWLRTSITQRGKWVWGVFLGVPIPAPPPTLPPLEATSPTAGNRPLTLRERNETHNANPSCQSCHRIFDPLGDALGNFDLVGRWQDNDAGQTIDASGTLWDGTRFSGPAEMRTALLRYRDSYYWNVISGLLTYALGRQPDVSQRLSIGPGGRLYTYEQPAVRAILRNAKPSQYTWSSIIAGIVNSPPFRMKNIVPWQ